MQKDLDCKFCRNKLTVIMQNNLIHKVTCMRCGFTVFNFIPLNNEAFYKFIDTTIKEVNWHSKKHKVKE